MPSTPKSHALSMVSSAQLVDRTVPAPSGSSVYSRHSHSTRRHRTGRSHHGGASQSTSNDFPIFTYTGDVEILIRANGQERRYLLHRLILAQCSGFFEASTSEEWARSAEPGENQPAANPLESDGSLARISEDETMSTGSTLVPSRFNGASAASPKKRLRYELDWDNKAEDEEPILVQKPTSQTKYFDSDFAPVPPSLTKPYASHSAFFRAVTHRTGMQSVLHLPQSSGTSDTAPDPLIRDYDNLFRLFYNYPPVLNSVNIATAYTECKSLLLLADMYDALSVTGPRVDHHLLGFGSRLFKQIAKYPPSYLKLGYLARSRVIFTEALIHVVGQWPAALPHLRGDGYSPLPNSIIDLIEDKVEDLEDLKARVESKLLRLTLTTSRGERVNPSNAYLDWLAVSLFRHWLIDSTTPPPAPILKSSPIPQANLSQDGRGIWPTQQPSAHRPHDSLSSAAAVRTSSGSSTAFSSARVYRLIGSASTQAYLTHDDLKKFLKVHPTPSSDSMYSRDVLKRFERKMDEIKRLAREIVKPLMRNFLELDLKNSDVGTSDPSSGAGGLPYLTCTRVEDEDLPWD